MTQDQIAEHLKKKGYKTSRQTVGRDIKIIKEKWLAETKEDVGYHVAKTLADLNQLELEAAILFQQFKNNGQVNSKEANRWFDAQMKVIKTRMDLLGLDKITAIAAKKLDMQGQTSDEKITNLKAAIITSIEKRENDDL
jgi:arginine repressor